MLLSKNIKAQLNIDIYGDGPYKTKILQLTNDYNLNNVFSFKGSVSNLFELYKNYDYLIHSSHEETFCYSVMEALAANVSVITTHEGGNVLGVVKNNVNGVLYNAKHILGLKTIIEDVFSGKKCIKANTRTLIEESFSISKMVENYFKLI